MKLKQLKKKGLLNITESTKTYICVLMLLSFGVYGFILDYYNEELLLPNIDLPNILQPLPIYDFVVYERQMQISSAWSLFIIFGLLFMFVELFKIKSKYLVTAIPVLIKYKLLLKLNQGMIEYVEWQKRR